MDDKHELSFEERHVDGEATLVYIHGALASPHEFSLVVPHLTKYHLLLPSLHDQSKGRVTFSLDTICSALASLIRNHAKGGRAHVFGLSMGGHVALSFAQAHPELVVSLAASGVPLFHQWPGWKQSIVPYVLYAQSVLPAKILPKQMRSSFIQRQLQAPEKSWCDELAASPATGDVALCNEIVKELTKSSSQMENLTIATRTLILAGTASGPGKFPDSVPDAQLIVKRLQAFNSESTGLQVSTGSHPWVIQVPELCGKIITAWIEQKVMPTGALPLEGPTGSSTT